jgi:hypothetical protein
MLLRLVAYGSVPLAGMYLIGQKVILGWCYLLWSYSAVEDVIELETDGF